MTSLSGKKKKELRARGQRLEACANIGRGGLTPGAVENVDAQLTRASLIKVRMPPVEPPERKRLAEALAEVTESSLVGMVGRTLLLYRVGPKTPENSA